MKLFSPLLCLFCLVSLLSAYGYSEKIGIIVPDYPGQIPDFKTYYSEVEVSAGQEVGLTFYPGSTGAFFPSSNFWEVWKRSGYDDISLYLVSSPVAEKGLSEMPGGALIYSGKLRDWDLVGSLREVVFSKRILLPSLDEFSSGQTLFLLYRATIRHPLYLDGLEELLCLQKVKLAVPTSVRAPKASRETGSALPSPSPQHSFSSDYRLYPVSSCGKGAPREEIELNNVNFSYDLEFPISVSDYKLDSRLAKAKCASVSRTSEKTLSISFNPLCPVCGNYSISFRIPSGVSVVPLKITCNTDLLAATFGKTFRGSASPQLVSDYESALSKYLLAVGRDGVTASYFELDNPITSSLFGYGALDYPGMLEASSSVSSLVISLQLLCPPDAPKDKAKEITLSYTYSDQVHPISDRLSVSNVWVEGDGEAQVATLRFKYSGPLGNKTQEFRLDVGEEKTLDIFGEKVLAFTQVKQDLGKYFVKEEDRGKTLAAIDSINSASFKGSKSLRKYVLILGGPSFFPTASLTQSRSTASDTAFFFHEDPNPTIPYSVTRMPSNLYRSVDENLRAVTVQLKTASEKRSIFVGEATCFGGKGIISSCAPYKQGSKTACEWEGGYSQFFSKGELFRAPPHCVKLYGYSAGEKDSCDLNALNSVFTEKDFVVIYSHGQGKATSGRSEKGSHITMVADFPKMANHPFIVSDNCINGAILEYPGASWPAEDDFFNQKALLAGASGFAGYTSIETPGGVAERFSEILVSSNHRRLGDVAKSIFNARQYRSDWYSFFKFVVYGDPTLFIERKNGERSAWLSENGLCPAE